MIFSMHHSTDQPPGLSWVSLLASCRSRVNLPGASHHSLTSSLSRNAPGCVGTDTVARQLTPPRYNRGWSKEYRRLGQFSSKALQAASLHAMEELMQGQLHLWVKLVAGLDSGGDNSNATGSFFEASTNADCSATPSPLSGG